MAQRWIRLPLWMAKKRMTNMHKDASPERIMVRRREADRFTTVIDGTRRRMQGAAQMADDKDNNMGNGSIEAEKQYALQALF